MVETAITTTITLTTGVPRADIHTRVHNRARDHRLRVHFPAPFRVDSANHDGHFEIVKRPVGIPSYDETWAEAPRPETHQRVFTSISDGNETLTIANRGLPEVEVIRDDHGTGSVIALTLLRCVGWLSRDDFTTRKNHAGPFLETPLAQMPGEWEFDYSIIPGLAGQSAYQEAWSFDTPLRSATTDIHPGGLSSSGSFLHVDDPRFVISTVKETEDGRGWIVRGYNTSGEEIPVTLQPWRKFRKAARTNLAEKPVGALKVGKLGDVHTRIMGHEIATFLFQE